jgi:hypothetical protein
LTAEVGGWQLEVSPAREVATEGSTGSSQRRDYEVGVRWSTPCEDLSPEAEERPLLEAVTKQHDTSLFVAVICEVYFQAVKLSRKSSFQAKTRL